ncbi:hypothetical protein J7E88_08870 [Streptomyces sp. ISL-10]|uniref:hypothetical protein n=1 Tax=Streptomyces sp. ISL-10 TaxID=2819172 RepID=UPI001BE8AB42|nr:hypothetical protein [Streptomyces sp. ISL-10]MBT2365427.1 hypothetical protein [Streptomyces sp. ISL-10]
MNTIETHSTQRGIPATAMSQAVVSDPQFRLPSRPQLCRGLHVVETPEGVVVDGAAERQHLRGDSASTVRETLFPLLDGTRDLAALAEVTGWSLATVHKAVATLYFAGLLEDADAAMEPLPGPSPSPQAATWMARTLDCSRVFPHSSHMAYAAAQAVVRLAVRSGWHRPLRDALADVGIVNVAPYDRRESDPAALVVLDLSAPAEVADSVLRTCAEDGLRVLLAGEDGDRITVGPLVDPSATACARCAWAAVRPVPDPTGRYMATGVPTPHDTAVTALIAEEIRAALLRNEPAASLGGQLVVDLGAAGTTTYKLTPEADCTTCYPTSAGARHPGPGEAALHYEYAVGFPPRHLVNPKAHQHHFRPENVGLQFERLRYPNNPRTPLSEVTLTDVQEFAETGKSPEWPEALAAVLRFTVGLRTPRERPGGSEPGRVLRWAPTGGNLGSPHAYLLLRGCPGMADGVHYYDAADHALTAMHPHTDHLTVQDDAVDADTTSGPRIHLLFASELARVARKYGPFSYRVGNLDVGCALAQLAIVANLTGLDYRLLDPDRWRPHRESLLGVSSPPLIAAVVQLTSGGNRPCL